MIIYKGARIWSKHTWKYVESKLTLKPLNHSHDTKSDGTLSKMVELVVNEVKEPSLRRLIITHCNAPQRAEQVKKMVLERVPFRECIIMDTRGVSSMYANDGGIIVTT